MLDPNPYKPNTIKNVEISRTENQTFRVYIHTLAQYSTFGPGSYGMSTLKKMTGTKSFEELPNHQKKCLVHNREECQTQKYLDQVQRECKCIPWALQNSQYKYKVQWNQIYSEVSILPVWQDLNYCSPDKEDCIANQTLKEESCLVTCEGLYTDIEDDTLRQTTQAIERNVVKGKMLIFNAYNGKRRSWENEPRGCLEPEWR